MSRFSDALKKISTSHESALPVQTPADDRVNPPYSSAVSDSFQTQNRRGMEKRRSQRHRCLIPAYAEVTFEENVWMGHGSVINVSEQGMLFYFRNTFSDGRENLKHAVIKATLQLQAGTEIKLEGRIIHAENSARVHLGVQFDSPSPGLLDSLFQICTA